MLVSELGPYLGKLLEQQRGGVVASVIRACQREHIGELAICNFLADGLKTIQADEKETTFGFAAKLLTLNVDTHIGEGETGKLSPLGCVILTTVLSLEKV